MGCYYPNLKGVIQGTILLYSERGVCFIREYVSSPIVARIARVTYNEPYKSAAMQGIINESDHQISAEYRLQDGQHKMRFFAKAEKKPFMPDANSLEHHFKEHELGVGRDRKGGLLTLLFCHIRSRTQ